MIASLFSPRWTFTQSRMPSFWVGTPRVPGGRARVMIVDDFGNAVDCPQVQFAASVTGASH